jgi:hypothetical protein
METSVPGRGSEEAGGRNVGAMGERARGTAGPKSSPMLLVDDERRDTDGEMIPRLGT